MTKRTFIKGQFRPNGHSAFLWWWLIAVPVVFLLLNGCSHPMPSRSLGKISFLKGPPLSGDFHTIASGDLDGDGFMDLVAGRSVPSGHDVIIWYGDGRGEWNKMVKLPVYGSVHSVALGDVNQDGLQDICLSVWEGTEGIMVWLNKGGDLWEAGHPPTRSGLFEGLLVVDINNDHQMDILATNYALETGSPGGIHIWLGGQKDWSDNVGPIASGRFVNAAVADFDLDSIPDLAGTSWGPKGQLMVWLGRKKVQNWATMPPLNQGNFWGIKAVDVNNDTLPDVIVSTYNEGIKIYYGKGNGLFSPPQSIVEEGHFWDILIHDINRDDCPDILASSFDDHGIRIWMNDGKCQRENYQKWVNTHGDMKIRIVEWKSSEGLFPNFGSYYDMLLDDFDQNGDLDLAVAHKGQGVKVWLNFADPKPLEQKNAESGADANQPETEKEKDQAEESNTTVTLVSNAQFEGHFLNGNKGSGKHKRIIKGNQNEGLNNRNHPEKSNVDETGSGRNVLREVLARDLIQDKENQVYRIIQGVPEYIIGPGDEVEITFWEGMDSKVYMIPVRPNGTISTPFFEDFKIAGLTAVEADNILTQKMKRFMHNPRIDIRTVTFSSKKATVLGAIARLGSDRGAGTYYLTGRTRVLDLIARAGGPGTDADLKKIEVIHKGVPRKINLYSAIFQGDLSQNLVVDHDDVIFIPKIEDTSAKVYIFGEVESPGIYPLIGELSVLDAIAKAGGYSKDARLDSIKVVRGDISDPQIISCNLKDLIEKGEFMENVYLLKNDLIYVPKSRIANLKLFAEKIDSLLKLVLYPVALVNTIEDPDALDLRLDIGF